MKRFTLESLRAFCVSIGWTRKDGWTNAKGSELPPPLCKRCGGLRSRQNAPEQLPPEISGYCPNCAALAVQLGDFAHQRQASLMLWTEDWRTETSDSSD